MSREAPIVVERVARENIPPLPIINSARKHETPTPMIKSKPKSMTWRRRESALVPSKHVEKRWEMSRQAKKSAFVCYIVEGVHGGSWSRLRTIGRKGRGKKKE